jgi:hypothetical protein
MSMLNIIQRGAVLKNGRFTVSVSDELKNAG